MTGYSPGKPSVDDEIEQLAQESSNTYSEFWNSKWTSAIPTTHFFLSKQPLITLHGYDLTF